jgi:hypothetical protein
MGMSSAKILEMAVMQNLAREGLLYAPRSQS